jgi:hypothetical protein
VSKTDWRLIAGNAFGVDNSGNVYTNSLIASKGCKIGNFNIGEVTVNGTKTSGLWIESGTFGSTTSSYSRAGMSANSIYLVGCDLTTAKFSTREYNNYYIEMSRSGLSSSKIYRTFGKNKSWTDREYVSVPGFRQADAAVDMKNVYPATLILYTEISVSTKVGSGWFDGVSEHYYGSWTVGNSNGFPTTVEQILTVQATLKGDWATPPPFCVSWSDNKVEVRSTKSCTVVAWAVCYAPTCKE